MNNKNQLSTFIILFITILLAGSCSEFANSPYPPISFKVVASIPGNGRASAVAFAIDGKGYVALGRDSLKNQLKDCWEYDPIANSWTEKTSFPGIARVKGMATVVDGKAYVGLGFNTNLSVYNYNACLKDFWMFDPVLNSWIQKADFPSNFTDACVSFAYNNEVYVGSGFNGDTFGKEFWKYSPTLDTWVKLNNFSGYARAAAVSCTNGVHVYFGTGYRTINENDWWEYYPANDTWNWIGYMPDNGRENAVSFSINNRFFITTGRQFGGTLTGGHVISDIFEFDSVRKVWYNRGDLPGARENAVAFVINGVGYIGFGENDTKVINDFWSFEP